MTRYKIWQTPAFAFFSTQFYRELGARGTGVGFKYLLALLAFACIIPPVKLYFDIQTLMTESGREIIRQLPNVTIVRGKLSIDRESPYFVKDPQSDQDLIAFDTKNQFSKPSESGAEMLVTTDSLFTAGRFGEHEFNFKNLDFYKVGPTEINRMFIAGSILIPTCQYMIGVLAAWVEYIVRALAYSLAGLILAKAISVNIKYEGILRIACFALGNVIILDMIVNIFPINIPGYGWMQVAIPGWSLYKLFIALGYTLFGVGANLSPPGFQSISDEKQDEPSSSQR